MSSPLNILQNRVNEQEKCIKKLEQLLDRQIGMLALGVGGNATSIAILLGRLEKLEKMNCDTP